MKFQRTRNPDNGNDHPTHEEGQEKRPAGHGAGQAVKLYKERPLDLRRADHRFLAEWKADLINDLGGPDQISVLQAAMADQAVSLLIILGKMSEYVEAHGVMEGNNLTACLRTSFLSYQNTFRLCLITAYTDGGKKGKGKKKPLDLESYLKSKEGQNEKTSAFEEEA